MPMVTITSRLTSINSVIRLAICRNFITQFLPKTFLNAPPLTSTSPSPFIVNRMGHLLEKCKLAKLPEA